ncbi:MAG: serine/threonine-protein kinase, partial [Acidimicrobiia bacterium]
MPEPLQPGRVLGGRYRLEREIARGGMGTVWDADDPLLARHVAVKTLDVAIGMDETIRARFRREAVTAAAVTHPNIVATYDTGEDDGVAYIVMELVHGITLRQLIDRDGALPVAQAADITYQVADALSVAHARGLVHRDVKPGNVLVQPDGRVKVTDFGIAKAADSGGEELTRTGMVVGTARYLAPEQVDGRDVDERVDLYSLGLVLYEMLCGKAPFEADTDIATAVARLTTPPRSIRLECPAVPPGLERV